MNTNKAIIEKIINENPVMISEQTIGSYCRLPIIEILLVLDKSKNIEGVYTSNTTDNIDSSLYYWKPQKITSKQFDFGGFLSNETHLDYTDRFIRPQIVSYKFYHNNRSVKFNVIPPKGCSGYMVEFSKHSVKIIWI